MTRHLTLLTTALLLGSIGCAVEKQTPLAEPSVAARADAKTMGAVLAMLFDDMHWTMVRDAGAGLPKDHALYRGRSTEGQAVTVRTAIIADQAQVRIDMGEVTPEPRERALERLRELFIRQGAKLEDPIEIEHMKSRLSLDD